MVLLLVVVAALVFSGVCLSSFLIGLFDTARLLWSLLDDNGGLLVDISSLLPIVPAEGLWLRSRVILETSALVSLWEESCLVNGLWERGDLEAWAGWDERTDTGLELRLRLRLLGTVALALTPAPTAPPAAPPT